MYKRILVPLDGTETARAGLREAITLAKQQHASLHLLHVVSDFPFLLQAAAVDYQKVRSAMQQRGWKLLQDASIFAESLGVPTETQLREPTGGRIADAIVDEARRAGCDLIAIGTHGRRGARRALLGSHAESVLRQSPVPVLLVRQPEASS